MKLKKILTIACLVVPMSAWAGGSAFINSAIVLQNAPQAIAASNKLKAEFQGRETELRNLLKEIKTKEGSFNKDSAIMSESKRKEAEKEILTLKRKFGFDQQSLKEDVQAKRKDAVIKLKTVISGVIDAFGKKKGYDFIFTQGVAYADKSVDITDEILAELKKKK